MPHTASPKRNATPSFRNSANLFATKSHEKRAWYCFLGVAVSMYLNFVLSVLNAHGLPMNSGKVTIIQLMVTIACGGLLISRKVRVRGLPVAALSTLITLLLVMNLLKTPQIKAFYDLMIIPLYISLGITAVIAKEKWMNFLFFSVVLIVILEVLLPSLYNSGVNPGNYYLATREWVADGKANDAIADGLYAGAYRGGGSFFGLTDHRVGGPFLEPLSLGYFSVLMAIYYSFISADKRPLKITYVLICLIMSLLSDSRAASALILICVPIIFVRPNFPSIMAWSVHLLIFLVGGLCFYAYPTLLPGDGYYRFSITFDALGQTPIIDMLIGNVPTRNMNDSGVLYLIYNFSPFGLLLALWYYCGLFTKRKNSSTALFLYIGIYASTTLLFGGALFSIKTASLMGYLVGIGSKPLQYNKIKRFGRDAYKASPLLQKTNLQASPV